MPRRPEKIPAHVGQKMRKWRTASGLSLRQVADRLGCSPGLLSGAENGNNNLSLPMFLDFCKAIETPPARVLEDRMLAKNRDVDRLASEFVKHASRGELEWLATLPRDHLRKALAAAHDAVDLARLRTRQKANSRDRDAG